MSDFRKMDLDEVRTCMKEWQQGDPDDFRVKIAAQQVMLYVMTGGGWIGESYAQRPKTAYTDTRVGKLPYSSKAVEQARKILVIMAEVAGLDPNDMPKMTQFHHCGVF